MSGKPKKMGGDKTVIIAPERDSTGSTAVSQPEPFLVQTSGRDVGHFYPLKDRKVRIGRDQSCEIMFDDPHVSRFHAEVFTNEFGQIVLKDLGSTNGVFVNGHKIQEKQLEHDDKILIGTRIFLKFCIQDAEEQKYQEDLFRAANIDNLTQLYNKKFFLDALTKDFSFSRRSQIPLSLLMMDVDHFKKINDQHGHLAGDLVLKSIGQFLIKNLRLENISGRYGGEEFAIFLRGVNLPLAQTIAERIRKGLEETPVDFRGEIIHFTVSIGGTTLVNNNFDTPDDLIHRADEYLYSAKEGGRNRTSVLA